MNKIGQIRRRVAEKYYNYELEDAARHGEALLREHWNNYTMRTKGYANDIYNLARVHDELGNFERAAELYTDGAQLYARLATDDDHESYANCINNLAAVLYDMGHEFNSAQLFRHLVTMRKFFGHDSDEIFADGLYNLANALSMGNHFQQAREWHTTALKIRRDNGNSEDIVDSLHSLAFLYEEKKEYEEAVPLAKTAMELAQGDDYISAVHYLAVLYEACGQYELALPRFEEVSELTRGRVGRSHESYVTAAVNHAAVLEKMGRVRESLAILTEVRAIMEGMSEDDADPTTYLECLRQMANLHKQLSEYDEAYALLMRSLRFSRHYNFDLIYDIVCLIRLLLHTNENERAMEVLVYALMHSEQKGPGLAQLLTHLAVAFSPTHTEQSPAPDAILEALRSMNDRTRLTPIITKWTRWENAPFIPNVVLS